MKRRRQPKLTERDFRRFKETLCCLEIEEHWYRFCDAALESIAREWLETHGIVYR